MVTPIHKGGDRGLCGNYRPVALTSHVIKVFERLIALELMRHLENEELLETTSTASGEEGLVIHSWLNITIMC